MYYNNYNNGYAYGLGAVGEVTITPDQIATVASGAASLDPKKSAINGAIVGTKVLPVIGTAIGAAIGYIAAGIAGLFKEKQYTFKKEVKNGLTYMTVKHIKSSVQASLIIDGIPRSVFCKCPWIGSCDPCRKGFEVFLQQLTGKALNDFVTDPNMFMKNYIQNNEYMKYIRDSVGKKGFDVNQLPILIFNDPSGLVLTISGDGQVLSNAPQQHQQNQQQNPNTLQAGFGWIGGIAAVAIAAMLWNAARQQQPQKKKS
jgi:hypothetical protein